MNSTYQVIAYSVALLVWSAAFGFALATILIGGDRLLIWPFTGWSVWWDVAWCAAGMIVSLAGLVYWLSRALPRIM